MAKFPQLGAFPDVKDEDDFSFAAKQHGGISRAEPEISISKQQASGQEPEEGEGNSRVLLVTYIDGSKSKIFLSPEDKLTFGPSIPGQKSYGPHEYALRIYRGNKETGLRAAFPGVRCFHESTITILPW